MSAAKITYSVAEAADATGYSLDVIRRAIRAGDLATTAPQVNGRTVARHVIPAAELERWVMGRAA